MNEPSRACPAYVSEACQLILGAWVLSVGASIILVYHGAVSVGTNPIGMALLVLAISALMGIPRFCLVARMKAQMRWARTATLVVLAVGWLLLARSLWKAKFYELDALSLIANALAVALEAFACTLLFSSKASL